MTRIDPDALASLLGGHERVIDYGYEETECSCGSWDDSAGDDGISYEGHLVEVAATFDDEAEA